MPFNNFIKFAVSVNFSNNKKTISQFPDNWTKLSESIYNGEENYAILTGKINDIIVIDIDLKDPEFKSLKWFEENFGTLPELNTLITKTISGGYHIFFKYNEKLKESKLKFKKLDIDILSNKRCVFQGKGYDILYNNPIRELSDSEMTLLLNTKDTKTIEKHKNPQLSYDEIREIILSLDNSRADAYDDWIRVGFFLSSILNGDKIFKEFSKKSIKYDKNTHSKNWENLCNSTCETPITIGTIFKWLKEDNITVFNKFQENNKIISELDKTTQSYGYQLEHKCVIKRNNKEIHASHNNDLEFIINEHKKRSKRCKNMDLISIVNNNGIILKCKNCSFTYPELPIKIDEELAPTIYNLILNFKTEDINNKDTTQVVKIIKEKFDSRLIINNGQWYLYNIYNGLYEKKAEECIRLEIDNLVEELKHNDDYEDWINWMQKIGYKDNIIKELKIYCYNEERLDDKEYLLGFNNGVLDLRDNVFRKGSKEEYITMKCNMDYNENTDTTLAETILNDIFPSKDEYEYAINVFSLCIYGKNLKQKMTMNYGFTASNGKSFLMERLKNAFGDYGDLFNVNLLTSRNKNAGDANSTLINFKNKRFLYCSEPETNQVLNINLVKTLTGDTIKARGLYDKNETLIKPTYQMFMCCNVLPKPDNEDDGFKRRINILEFKTRFVENPKNKTERKLINFTEEKTYEIEVGIIHLLIKNYINLSINDFVVKIPIQVKNIIDLYTNESTSELTNLLTENFKISTEKDFVTVKEIRELLNSNNIKKDTITIINLLKLTFPECIFHDRKKINNKDYYNIFLNLKNAEQ